jgi:glutamine amidotransferase-like uncharacterized protein
MLCAVSACLAERRRHMIHGQEQLETRPLALVCRERSPAGCPGCAEAVAELLEGSRWHFEVRYVGSEERWQLSPDMLRTAALYAQPGGSGELTQAYRVLKSYERMIRSYVASGGRYLGICMGGYLAGRTPGFHLLPGDTDQYVASRGASVKTTQETLISLRWRGQMRTMYFQDGPAFILDRGASNVIILATYTNGQIAALVAACGQGQVAVAGPHPEATAAWYEAYQLVNPEGARKDLGYDLLDTLMSPS